MERDSCTLKWSLRLSLLALSFLAASARGAATPDGLLQLLDYVGVDYPTTVHNGQVVNSAEYLEQQEFSEQIQNLVKELPASSRKAKLLKQAAEVAGLIKEKSEGDRVAALAAEMRADIVEGYGVEVTPRRPPDLEQAATLYQENCAGCHGAQGYGDGPQAPFLQPAPSNFHATERQFQRSLYGLYNTITLGVEGTAMTGFNRLSDAQRWALAFYVGNFPFADSQRAQGAALWQADPKTSVIQELKALTTLTPEQIAARDSDRGLALMAYLRSRPDVVTHADESLLQVSSRKLAESLARYREGGRKTAYELAVSAYLEGFELAEASLNAVDPELRERIEREMLAYRNLIKQTQPAAQVATQEQRLQELLAQAGERLQSTALSPAMSFTSGVVILLREGLEAILLLAAIAAFLIKAERRDALPYLHVGWISALLLGGVTWAVAAYAIDISGASRELTEGLTALLAAGILFYVGLWLHNKMHARQWQRFIQDKVHNALNGRTLWALALVSFIAVYREVFETVLFYQALWVQSGPAGQHLVLAGLAVAAVALLALSWLIFRFSVRLPLRLFFGVNAALLYVLAFVFVGNGIAALQEAGKLPVNPVSFPEIDLLGIHPNLQALGLQAALVIFTLIWTFRDNLGLRRAP